MSRIHINGIRQYLGTFKTELEAKESYIQKLKSI